MRTIQELHDDFKENILPLVLEQYGHDDQCAIDEAWDNWTDGECRDGAINDLLYHYCPAFEGADNVDTIPHVIEAMGFNLKTVQVPSRVPADDQWSKDAFHYHCTLAVGDIRKSLYGENAMTFYYSMGSGHGRVVAGKTLPPKKVDICDVIHSLVMDASVLDYDDCEDWALDYGYNPDSRLAERTYNQCREQSRAFVGLLGKVSIEDMAELFQDY